MILKLAPSQGLESVRIITRQDLKKCIYNTEIKGGDEYNRFSRKEITRWDLQDSGSDPTLSAIIKECGRRRFLMRSSLTRADGAICCIDRAQAN